MKTIKYLLWALAASCCLTACGGSDSDSPNPNPNPNPDEPTPGDNSGLVVKISKTVIKSDGVDFAEIQTLYNGQDVTGEAAYFTTDGAPIDLTSGKYSTTKPSVLKFWASYLTFDTSKTPSTITAVENTTLERPDDPQPESTNFVRRVLALQYTGTECPNCPRVILAFRNMEKDPKYADMFVHAADHSYKKTDPMYRDDLLAREFGVNAFPTVIVDMRQTPQSFESAIADAIESNYKRMEAPAGISVSSEVSGDTVVAMVSVKAGEENKYSIGAMVLESNITATQYNNGTPGDFSVHENAIRLIDAGRNFRGHDLGTIKAGEVVDHQFTFNLDSNWKKEDCHLVFYICAPEGSSTYVCNAIATDGLTANKPYEYKK